MVLVLACVLPSVLVLLALVHDGYRRGQQQLYQDASSRARAAALAVDREISAVEGSLEALSTSPHIAAGEWPAFYAQARQMQRRTGLRFLLTEPATRRLAVDTAGPAAGRPGPASAGSVAVPSVTVRTAQGVRHELSARLSNVHLTMLLEEQNLPASWGVSLFHGDGTPLANLGGPVMEPVELPLELLQSPDGRPADRLHPVRGADGERLFLALERPARVPWIVAVAVPAAEAESMTLAHSVLAGVGALTALLCGLAVAGYVARRIVASIEDLGAIEAPTRRRPAYFREAEDMRQVLTTAAQALRETQLQLEAKNTRLEHILEAARDAIVATDRQRRIVLFNPAAERMFGRRRDEVLGRPLELLLPQPAPDGDPGSAAAGHPLRSGAVRLARRADGSAFPIEASLSHFTEDGQLFHTAIVRDITRRVQREEALLRSNADLQQFAYAASHDLKAPLRSIAGFVQVLQRLYAHRLDARGQDMLARVARAAGQMDELTEALLQFARLECGSDMRQPADCAQLVRQAVHLLQPRIDAAGLQLELGELPTLPGNPPLLLHVFLNLVDNVLKYQRPGVAPVLRIAARRLGERWELAFDDNGVGVQEQQRGRIFEGFVRLHRHEEIEGAGMGLAICRRIVERHQGTIWVDAKTGPGSLFKIALPAA